MYNLLIKVIPFYVPWYKNVSIHRNKSSIVLVPFGFCEGKIEKERRSCEENVQFIKIQFISIFLLRKTAQIFIFVHIFLDQLIHTSSILFWNFILYNFFARSSFFFPLETIQSKLYQYFHVPSALYFNSPTPSPPPKKKTALTFPPTPSRRLITNRMFRYRVTNRF